MVRFGSADLWTSALGVKRVQRSDPPGPETVRGQKRPQTAKIQLFATDLFLRAGADLLSGDLFLRVGVYGRHSTLEGGSVREAKVVRSRAGLPIFFTTERLRASRQRATRPRRPARAAPSRARWPRCRQAPIWPGKRQLPRVARATRQRRLRKGVPPRRQPKREIRVGTDSRPTARRRERTQGVGDS